MFLGGELRSHERLTERLELGIDGEALVHVARGMSFDALASPSFIHRNFVFVERTPGLVFHICNKSASESRLVRRRPEGRALVVPTPASFILHTARYVCVR